MIHNLAWIWRKQKKRVRLLSSPTPTATSKIQFEKEMKAINKMTREEEQNYLSNSCPCGQHLRHLLLPQNDSGDKAINFLRGKPVLRVLRFLGREFIAFLAIITTHNSRCEIQLDSTWYWSQFNSQPWNGTLHMVPFKLIPNLLREFHFRFMHLLRSNLHLAN